MMNERHLEDLYLPVPERLTVNACATIEARRILCGSVGRGQTADALAERNPNSTIGVHFLDTHAADDARELTAARPNLQVHCSADLPPEEIDLFVLPVNRSGEAELTRELLQDGYDRLVIGGTLIAAVDNPRDTWLHHEIEKFAKNLDRTPKRHGVVYRVKKKIPLKRRRDFSKEFAFRDGERLVRLFSRPGVFSHRRLDLGARALIETMQIQSGDRVLDIGCGCGAAGLAAALREPNVTVHAIDSNARAVECTQRGAALNEIDSLTVAHGGEGPQMLERDGLSGTFDVVVGNPPYYSNYRIAEIFLQTARTGLKPGGRIFMVTRSEEWLVARMQQLFDTVAAMPIRGYTVVSGVCRDRADEAPSANTER